MSEYQPFLFYQNINYQGIINDTFYFHGIQDGYGIVKDILLYNPVIGGSTLSSDTLDVLVMKE